MMNSIEQRIVIVAYRWDGDRAQLRVRPVDGPSSLVDSSGFSLHYRVDPVPVWHCPGHIPWRSGRGDYVDCLNGPQPGGRNCVDCAVAEATFAGSLHHAHLRSPDEIEGAVDDHLRQPHVLYLATFGEGSIKVGTSTSSRTGKRLLEQGALAATIVAEAADGIVVRRVEDLVTDQLGIPQSVGATRKLKGLVNPLSSARLEAALDHGRQAVHDLLDGIDLGGDSPESELTPATRPWANPALVALTDDKLFPYRADLRRHAHQLTIDYMVGRMAVTRSRSGDRFAIDLGRLFGLELELGQFDPVEITVQDSLF